MRMEGFVFHLVEHTDGARLTKQGIDAKGRTGSRNNPGRLLAGSFRQVKDLLLSEGLKDLLSTRSGKHTADWRLPSRLFGTSCRGNQAGLGRKCPGLSVRDPESITKLLWQTSHPHRHDEHGMLPLVGTPWIADTVTNFPTCLVP